MIKALGYEKRCMNMKRYSGRCIWISYILPTSFYMSLMFATQLDTLINIVHHLSIWSSSLLRSLWCSAFFIWQSPGRNPLPNLGGRLGPETLIDWVSERLPQKKAEHSLVFCLFYLAKSRSESTAQIGRETWVFDCLIGCQKRYHYTAFQNKAEHFWLLSFLRSLWCSAFFIWSPCSKTLVVDKPSKRPLLMPTAISRWIHQFSSDHWS